MGLVNIFKPLSTFLLAGPVINLNNIDNLFPLKKIGNAGNQTRAPGSRRRCAKHCAMVPRNFNFCVGLFDASNFNPAQRFWYYSRAKEKFV